MTALKNPRRQSPEAAPPSTAHVDGAMARSSQAPVLVLTAPYASAIRIAMAVDTAAAYASDGATDDKVAAAIATPSSPVRSDFMNFMDISYTRKCATTRKCLNANPQRCVICCADLQNRRSFKGLVGGPSGPMRRPARATSSHLPTHCASIGVSVGTPSTPPSAAP